MRHKHIMDAIATKDRGFSLSENQQARIPPVQRIDTSAELSQNQAANPSAPQNQHSYQYPHQQPPPSRRRRDDSLPPKEDYGPPSKRTRAMFPPRERLDRPPPRWRGSPAWDGDIERQCGRYPDDPPRRRMDRERDNSRDQGPSGVPSIVSWCLGNLPRADAFDGMFFPHILRWMKWSIHGM